MTDDPSAITQLLHKWRDGDREALREIVERMYKELHGLAQLQMRGERPGHTLQATALVNELYLRLSAGKPVALNDRAHLLAVAARQVRRILVNHARDRRAEKRGGGAPKLSLEHLGEAAAQEAPDVLDLDLRLNELERLDPRAARTVELRYFGGLTEEETAEALAVSVATVKRDWAFARTWLARSLR